jgi:hypothetical protein
MNKNMSATKAIAGYLAHLQTLTTADVRFIPGRKYGKVVFHAPGDIAVHSFIDLSTGDLLKAASWNVPAKGVRFNLLTELDTVITVADRFGGYLYKR